MSYTQKQQDADLLKDKEANEAEVASRPQPEPKKKKKGFFEKMFG